MRHRFDGTLWRYEGEAPWHFVTLPQDLADEIETASHPKAFGSVRVHVTIGATSWSTSLFPDKGSESYVLPIKKAVRAAEGLVDGDDVKVALEIVDGAAE